MLKNIKQKFRQLLILFVITSLALLLFPQNTLAVADGTPGTWNTATATTGAGLAANVSVSYNGYVYTYTGIDSSLAQVGTFYYGKIGSAGNITSLSTGTTATVTSYAGGAALNGYTYLFGGYNGTSNLTTVTYAAINSSNGSIGSWSSTTSLPQAICKFAYTQSNRGYIYVLGGTTSTSNAQAITNVYYTLPNSSTGAISSWSTGTALPTALILESAVVADGYLYVIGGVNTSGTTVNTVYYAQVNSNGSLGPWNTGNTFPISVRTAAISTYRGYIYITGGYNGSSYLTSSYYTLPNSDGSISGWHTGQNLSNALGTFSGVASNGYLYTLGGYNSGGTQNYVYYASLTFANTGSKSISANYNNLSPATSQGGCNSSTSSTSYSMNCTIGQFTPSGSSSSSHFILKSGYQYFDYGFEAPYVNFSLNSSTVNFGTIPSNTLSTGTNTITIATNAVHGYNLYVQENHDLQNASNSAVTIPAFTGSSTTSAITWTSNTVNGLGYSVSGSDVTPDFSATAFRAFDASSSHLIASTYQPTQTSGGDTSTITYQVDPSSTTAAGYYTNTITYTVIGVY